ncbi:MAG: hypothetical protein Q9P14_13060 [candidate division KSB1 bacterium]|nr:hypothetical protein [candidate division KSB1 bacterium]
MRCSGCQRLCGDGQRCSVSDISRAAFAFGDMGEDMMVEMIRKRRQIGEILKKGSEIRKKSRRVGTERGGSIQPSKKKGLMPVEQEKPSAC